MKYLDVRLRLPDRMLHPMASFVRHGDVVRYEELRAWNLRPDEGVEYELFYAEADPDAYREALESVPSIREYRLAPIDDASLHVWVCEETRPEVRSWRAAFADRHLVVVPPVRFDAAARMGLTVVGEAEDLQGVLAALPEEVEVTVHEIGSYDRRGGALAGALTDRQREAVRTALERGYYEVPREACLADVADALDRAESSTSLLLRRAEREMLSRVLERYGEPVSGRRS